MIANPDAQTNRIANPIGRAIHDNAVFNCSGKHISPIADAVYILWQMQYIFFGGWSIYSLANEVAVVGEAPETGFISTGLLGANDAHC